MARNTKRLFRAFTTKSSRGEKWRKSTTHSVTRVARVPHGPGAPKLIKWRFSGAHRRRFRSFPHIATTTTGQLAVARRDAGRKVEELQGARWSSPREEGGAAPGSKVAELRGARWRAPGVQSGGTQGCKVGEPREEGGAAPGRKVEQPQGARWRNSGERGGGTPGSKVEGPREQGGGTPGSKLEELRGARWRDPGVQGGGQREHHETTRETQWGDFCKAVRELAHRSGIEAMANERTRGERLRRRPGQTWR